MITPDNTAEAEDFINESEADGTPSNDNGRVAKLENYNGVDRQIGRKFLKANVRFGGDGSDGALVITTGTTTVDLAGERVVILNYSSISITGTGKLAFSNPHANGTTVIIKCEGEAVLTSSTAPMIDLEGIGADAGGGGTRTSGPANTAGDDGTDGQTPGYFKTNKGTSTAGGAVASLDMVLFGGGVTSLNYEQILAKYPHIFVGAGGNGGRATVQSGSGTTTGGDGGRGGGCLIMEIAGAINFTTANGISVAGQNGDNGVVAGAAASNGGGGGGGGGGCAFIFYNDVIAFTGTIKVSGGVGGNCIVQGGTNGQGGSGGGSLTNAGGTGGNSSTNGAKTGGDGGAGLAVNSLNTEYA